MKAVLSYSNILYTHIYTHKRIKDNRLVRRTGCLQYAICSIPYAIGINGVLLPNSNFVGRRTPNKQLVLDKNLVDDDLKVCAWRCLVMEKEAGRKWIVKCSDDAFPDSEFGWVCDCGNWTFGDDDFHAPIFSRIIGKVVNGRVWSCRR